MRGQHRISSAASSIGYVCLCRCRSSSRPRCVGTPAAPAPTAQPVLRLCQLVLARAHLCHARRRHRGWVMLRWVTHVVPERCRSRRASPYIRHLLLHLVPKHVGCFAHDTIWAVEPLMPQATPLMQALVDFRTPRSCSKKSRRRPLLLRLCPQFKIVQGVGWAQPRYNHSLIVRQAVPANAR